MQTPKTNTLLLCAIGFALTLSNLGTRAYKSVQFDTNFTSKCINAVQARDVGEAKAELDKAIGVLESEGLTSGSTSVLFYTTHDDLGIFYQRLKARRELLEYQAKYQLDPLTIRYAVNASMTSYDNTLDLWFRPIAGMPWGISVYPKNGLYILWLTTGITLLATGLARLVVEKTIAEERAKAQSAKNKTV